MSGAGEVIPPAVSSGEASAAGRVREALAELGAESRARVLAEVLEGETPVFRPLASALRAWATFGKGPARLLDVLRGAA